MKQLRRVVWSEGMYLAPQHFQTQGRYLEDSVAFAMSSLWFAPHGLLSLAIDPDALKTGTVSLLQARGVMPDGLAFHIPESDEPPPARPIGAAFSPTSDSHVLYLAVPHRRDGLPNVADSAAPSGARFISDTQLRSDETTGTEERVVNVGRKNFSLLLDTELNNSVSALPVARIRRAGGEKFALDDQFVPPLLDISASPRVVMMLRELVGVLEEKSNDMGGRREGSGQAAGDYWRRELASFWFLHTIHASIPILRHLLLAKHGHPEELFRELSRLGGALCSFSLNSHPRDLPLYDHDRLTECLSAIEVHIRRHLELIMPTNVVQVPFQAAESYFWTAPINDPRLLDRSRWLFEIQSRAGEATLISQTPRLVKICSEKFIREVVRRAVPGLTLTHLPVPPPSVPAKVEAQYFGISKSGPCWDHILATRQVGLYVPGEFPAAEVSLMILLED
jgi:type VI secretion system protein ImpJ